MLTFVTQLSGCKDISIESASARLIDCSVRSVGLTAIVTEHGTGVTLQGTGRIRVSSSPISFEEIYKDNYMKPSLPYYLKVCFNCVVLLYFLALNLSRKPIYSMSMKRLMVDHANN